MADQTTTPSGFIADEASWPQGEDELLMRYRKCGKCDALFPFSFDSMDVDHPAPCCGGTGIRMVWNVAEGAEILALAQQQQRDERGTKIGCILVCAACEAIMNQILWTIIGLRTEDVVLADALLERKNGRDSLLKLYESLSRVKPAKALEAAGLQSWFEAWRRLATQRNQFAHGDWLYSREQELPSLVDSVRDGALEAFVALHNAAISAVRAALTLRSDRL